MPVHSDSLLNMHLVFSHLFGLRSTNIPNTGSLLSCCIRKINGNCDWNISGVCWLSLQNYYWQQCKMLVEFWTRQFACYWKEQLFVIYCWFQIFQSSLIFSRLWLHVHVFMIINMRQRKIVIKLVCEIFSKRWEPIQSKFAWCLSIRKGYEGENNQEW